MRIVASAISVNTGCSASTARGTLVSCAISTATAATRPAVMHTAASRLTSPKPLKRHIPLGTWNSRSSTPYSATMPSITQWS